MDRNKALDKIQKCLALGKSANEHEAAAALRQAQKLMERHGVTQQELDGIGYSCEQIQTSIQAGKKSNLPVTLSMIIGLMQEAFGVRSIVEPELRKSDYNWTVNYYGPEDRVMLAVYAHTVVARAVEEGWKTFLKANPLYKGKPGGRSGYYYGWINSVKKQILSFAMSEEETASTEKLIAERAGTNIVAATTTRQKLYNKPVASGQGDGSSFKLHRPMGASREGLEKL